MTNDMIALASNWGYRLRPPKCNRKKDPQFWAISFLHLLTLTQWFLTFFVLFTLYQHKKKNLPPRMFDFSGKGQAKFPWNVHSDT